MKRFYFEELKTLRNHMLLMAEKSMFSVRYAVQALVEGDANLAYQVLKGDDEIDQLEVDIDAEASRYITLRAPVASDMRLVTVAIRTSHDLERIGDEATSIAKRTIRLSEGDVSDLDLGAIPKLAELALAQIRASIDCLIEEDASKAHSIPAKDQEIDDLHRANNKLFIDRVILNPETAAAQIDLIFISKSLERIGDHATNIAEEIVYLLRGHDIRHTDKKQSVDN